MGMISRLRGRCFCAYCKAERKVYTKKHVSLTNVLAASFLAMAITFTQWGAPDPRGLMIFCVFILIAETFVYTRWRASMTCNLCGFDPLIYKRSPEQAALRVRRFFEEQQKNPRFQLSRSPLLEIQKQRLLHERKVAIVKAFEAKIRGERPVATTAVAPKSGGKPAPAAKSAL